MSPMLAVPVAIPLPGRADVLHGELVVPAGAPGVVVFAHGSGSSRHSPRNRQVAEGLRARGLGTLLMDLLTSAEEAVDLRTRTLRFDIDLLAGRLEAAIDWVRSHPEGPGWPVGLFGASTGAGAALVAGARRPAGVAAIVSRGGRPDLAGDHLAAVRAPTLLIVGGLDHVVVDLNQEALDRLVVERSLEIVPGATHLFEQPGTLEQVERLAGEWFVDHLGTRAPAPGRRPPGGSG